MIPEPDRLAAELFVRGEPLPPALQYTSLVESLRHAQTEQEKMEIWRAIEAIKNANGGHIPK